MAISTIDNNGANLGQLGNRNMVTNGSMAVTQRGTSFTAPASSTFTLDRWKYEESTANVVNVEQSSDAPAGFERSIKVTTTTAAGSVGSNDFAQLLYKIEGYDLSRLAYGTSDAKTSTISFWVKSSVTGSFPFGLQNHDGTRVFPVTYTVNSANTWEYKTITIAGDTGGTWTTNNNTTGMRFTFLWISGSNFTGGVDGGGWAATTGFANLTSSYTANLDVVNATFQITGVQLEVGDTATPFEHRSYGEELAKCQRYYSVIKPVQAHPIWIYTSTNWSTTFPHPTTMRVVPSISFTGTPVNTAGGTNATNNFSAYSDGAWRGMATLSASQSASSVDISRIDGTTNSAVTSGFSGGFYMGSECSINMDAEL